MQDIDEDFIHRGDGRYHRIITNEDRRKLLNKEEIELPKGIWDHLDKDYKFVFPFEEIKESIERNFPKEIEKTEMYKTLITEDRLKELVRLADLTPKDGLIVELGVYKGGSLKYMMDNLPVRLFAGFDTFEGLPKEQWNEDEIHKPGDFNDNSIEIVEEYLKDYVNFHLYKGLFPKDIPESFSHYKVSFVHCDLDFYEGAKACIEYFYPKLPVGGIIVFDDYLWENCPGVKKALEESKLKYQPTNAKFQAYIIKE